MKISKLTVFAAALGAAALVSPPAQAHGKASRSSGGTTWSESGSAAPARNGNEGDRMQARPSSWSSGEEAGDLVPGSSWSCVDPLRNALGAQPGNGSAATAASPMMNRRNWPDRMEGNQAHRGAADSWTSHPANSWMEKPSDEAAARRDYFDSHGWLGVETAFSWGENHDPVITKIFSEGPAAAAGLQLNDEITSLNGVDFGAQSWSELQDLTCRGFRSGDQVQLTVRRGDTIVPVTVTLEPVRETELSQMISELGPEGRMPR